MERVEVNWFVPSRIQNKIDRERVGEINRERDREWSL